MLVAGNFKEVSIILGLDEDVAIQDDIDSSHVVIGPLAGFLTPCRCASRPFCDATHSTTLKKHSVFSPYGSLPLTQKQKAMAVGQRKGWQNHSRPLSYSPAVAFKQQNAAALSKVRACFFRFMMVRCPIESRRSG